MTLDWLWSKLNHTETETLRNCLDIFGQEEQDFGLLKRLSNDPTIRELEKRFLADSPEQLVDEELKGRVLIATVGFRPQPVILTTLLLRPTQLYLLHSEESRFAAEIIRDDSHIQKLGLLPEKTIFLRRVSLTDAPFNYGRLRDIIDENLGESFVIDITGGVKVMGVSLATAAFWLRLPVIYLFGEEVMGIIRPFSEKLTRLQNPFTFFGSPDLQSIVRLFNQADYDAALAVCHSLSETIGDVQTLGMLAILAEFITLYRDWDLFVHSIACDQPERKLASRMALLVEKLRRFDLRFADPDQISRNLAFLTELEDSWLPKKRNNAEPYRMADILTSAHRRAAAGKYDDAVGRLYRCLEMAATVCLMRHCAIDNPSQPNFDHFISLYGTFDLLGEAFKALARYPLPAARLGLKDQMVLLRLSDLQEYHPMYYIFRSMDDDGLMEIRNRSTLAHGTIPVTANDYERFVQKTVDILGRALGRPELDVLLAGATHPTLLIYP